MEVEGKASGGWGVPAAMSAEESQLSMSLMPFRRKDGFPPSGHPRINGEEFYEDVVAGREGGSTLEHYSSVRVGHVASVLDDK